MDKNLFESLLYQQESETLDFKQGQYAFVKATDKQKAEILKDILAFANSWRQTDAHILIGVEEVRGGRSVVRGVSDHLLNRNLQQFVSSKINRPISFSYSEETFGGLPVDIIMIPVQDRPFYLLKAFGGLDANVVYIRRGDTTAVASPEEVFRMGAASAKVDSQPTLDLEFADLGVREKLGKKIEIHCNHALVPNKGKLPDYGQIMAMENRNYYREIASWFHETLHLNPVGLVITNSSSAAAEDVIVTLEFQAVGISMRSDGEMPPVPSPHLAFRPDPKGAPPKERVDVSLFEEFYEVQAYFGTVQPGTTKWSQTPFYIGARQASLVESKVTISANNLRVPVRLVASISIDATPREITVVDIKAFALK